jgi:DNA-binding transcriptional MerR regulator
MYKEEGKVFNEFKIGADEPIYPSGVVVKLLGIPMHVLKQLDEEDIVKPPRKKGRARLYSKRELKKLENCWYYMKRHKVNIGGLKVILGMEGRYKQK